jgi:anthranilate/para-aminobenzoate synthase component I
MRIAVLDNYDSFTYKDALRAAFPAGTGSRAPSVRALEIIERARE